MRLSAAVLMVVAALTLLGASAVHASLLGPIDPFAGAVIPEAVIGVVLAVAALVAWSSTGAWPIGFGATLFAIVGTLFGLTVTLPRGDPGDIVYHVSLLAILVLAAAVLIAQRRRA